MIWPFENNTSGITSKIVSAKLKHDKLKKHLSILAIALAAMLMCVVLLVLSGIVTVNSNGGNHMTGSYHALISNIDQQEYEKLRDGKEGAMVGLTAFIGSSSNGSSRLNISCSDTNSMIFNNLQVEEGRLPELENEILIEKDYLVKMGIQADIGDSITILMPDTRKENTFTVSGYLKTGASGTKRELFAALVSEQYFNAQNGWETFSASVMIRVDKDSASSKDEIKKNIDEILKKAGIHKYPSINESYINLSKPSPMMIGAAAAGMTVIAAAGVLVIYSIFYISIINSIKEYGQLRTVGMTGKQIKRLVFREGFLLSVYGIPIGLASGTVLSYLLVPQGFRTDSLLWAWPAVAVLVFITVRLSIKKPADIAAGASPIDAYRYAGPEKESRSSGHRKLSPGILAKKHIFRYRKKNMITVISLVLTGILLLGLSSVLSSINAEEMSLSGFPKGQFYINITMEELREYPLNQIQADNPFTDELYQGLTDITGAEEITAYYGLPAALELEMPEPNVTIVSFSREDMELIRSCSTGETIIDYDLLTSANQLIIGSPESFEKQFGIHTQVGQIITIKIFDGNASRTMDFEIAAVLDENKIGNHSDKIDWMMLSQDSIKSIVAADTMNQIAIRVTQGKEAQAEAEIEQLLREYPRLSIRSLSAAISENENFIQGMMVTLFTSVVFIGSFAVMNLVNTILTGIITRQKEFALMRSVGMSQRQLFTMVRYESMIITSIGAVLSLIVGGGVGKILCTYLKNEVMSYLNYRFPFGTALIYCIVMILCTLFVTGAAIRQQNKLSMIEQLHK